MSTPYSMLSHGDPVEVGDWLAGDETGASLDPAALRAALINALDRIARLDAEVQTLREKLK